MYAFYRQYIVFLIDKTKHGVNTKLKIWNNLELKGLGLSNNTKTKYTKCKYSKNRNKNEGV